MSSEKVAKGGILIGTGLVLGLAGLYLWSTATYIVTGGVGWWSNEYYIGIVLGLVGIVILIVGLIVLGKSSSSNK